MNWVSQIPLRRTADGHGCGGLQADCLPLHAAGDHSNGSTKTTLDRVISSYSPTIRALAYARKAATQRLEKTSQSILLAAMPHTPGNEIFLMLR